LFVLPFGLSVERRFPAFLSVRAARGSISVTARFEVFPRVNLALTILGLSLTRPEA
jgi:hypothetical protein